MPTSRNKPVTQAPSTGASAGTTDSILPISPSIRIDFSPSYIVLIINGANTAGADAAIALDKSDQYQVGDRRGVCCDKRNAGISEQRPAQQCPLIESCPKLAKYKQPCGRTASKRGQYELRLLQRSMD